MPENVYRKLCLGNVIVFGPDDMFQTIDMGNTVSIPRKEEQITEAISGLVLSDMSSPSYDRRSKVFSLALNLLVAYAAPHSLFVSVFNTQTRRLFNISLIFFPNTFPV